MPQKSLQFNLYSDASFKEETGHLSHREFSHGLSFTGQSTLYIHILTFADEPAIHCFAQAEEPTPSHRICKTSAIITMAAADLTTQLVPLEAAVQNYAWGMPPTSNSLVARVHSLNSGASVNDALPYAELWMGVHPSGPARLASNKEVTLSQFLDSASVPTIPYLLKILSVSKPLSIQAHPHKELAAQLHKQNPKAYKDDNHKPEMCVALTGTS